ncbi:hypothetical protein A9Q94_08430 [Rhodobacterales bacterium 56_14_T64]|mgnify:CR=1 FL=1|nr:hypothetical protein A9Q94_08430 [Rhodobacterales bacterium 56_14_T64]
MAKPRSYKLLCPIARALDRIGDRWTLLILRDLHAGPARFTDIQRGLSGISVNLLTERLAKLTEDELVEKVEGEHGVALYGLTNRGRKTRDILFDLAQFGGLFPPPEVTVRPGNLRLIAVTLGTAVERSLGADVSFNLSMIVDGEAFSLQAADGSCEMLYRRADNPDMTLRTSYEALLAVSENELSLTDFAQNHCQIEVSTPGKDQFVFAALSAALAGLQEK